MQPACTVGLRWVETARQHTNETWEGALFSTWHSSASECGGMPLQPSNRRLGPLDSRFEQGRYLGPMDGSNTVLVGTASGVVNEMGLVDVCTRKPVAVAEGREGGPTTLDELGLKHSRLLDQMQKLIENSKPMLLIASPIDPSRENKERTRRVLHLASRVAVFRRERAVRLSQDRVRRAGDPERREGQWEYRVG